MGISSKNEHKANKRKITKSHKEVFLEKPKSTDSGGKYISKKVNQFIFYIYFLFNAMFMEN